MWRRERRNRDQIEPSDDVIKTELKFLYKHHNLPSFSQEQFFNDDGLIKVQEFIDQEQSLLGLLHAWGSSYFPSQRKESCNKH